MKILTPEFDAALRQRSINYGFFSEINGKNIVLRVWSGAGTKNWNGFEWRGVGRMGRVVGIGETAEVRTSETEYQLVAPEIDDSTQDFIDNDARGMMARTWIALFDENERVIPDPIMLDESVINHAVVDVSDTMEAMLKLVANSAMFDFRQAPNVAITHEQQQEDFPGDTGFDRMPKIADKQVKWTKT